MKLIVVFNDFPLSLSVYYFITIAVNTSFEGGLTFLVEVSYSCEHVR